MLSAWTWLVYAATHSSDEEIRCGYDLAPYGGQSISLMARAHRGDRLRVLVQQDSAHAGSQRFEAGTPRPQWESLGKRDSGDPETLLDFLRWGVRAAPAERYALILWSHGSGWQPDYSTRPSGDRGDDDELEGAYFSSTSEQLEQQAPGDRAIAGDNGTRQALDTVELGRVMAAAAEAVGGPIDLLLMNACQMASAEVVYQLRAAVGVYVATEVNMPAQSLPYDAVLSRLGAEPTMDADALGRLLVEQYCASMASLPIPWNTGGYPPGATMTALRPPAMAGVAAAVRALATALRADLAGQMEALKGAVKIAPTTPARSEFRLGDLAVLARLLLDARPPEPIAAAARALIAAVRDPALIVARRATSAVFEQSAGLTTFLPLPNLDGRKMVATAYAELDYARDSGWAELLTEWHRLY